MYFLGKLNDTIFALQADRSLSRVDIAKLNWLFGNAQMIEVHTLDGYFVGSRTSMITSWSTNIDENTWRHQSGIYTYLIVNFF